MNDKRFVVYEVVVVLLTFSLSGMVNAHVDDIGNRGTCFSELNKNLFPPQSNWTVMMYFACDNYRSRLNDGLLETLESIGSTEDVNIIALVDGETNGDTRMYYVHKDILEPLSWYETESDMSDPSTFQRFIEVAKTQYPAAHYALFTLSQWGSGWQGVFSDTHGTGSTKTLSLITMPQITEVLRNVTDNGTHKIDVWGIDVCLGGMVEIAYEITPYVKYMVANEEHGFEGYVAEEGYRLDWNYSFFIQQLLDNPGMSPEDFSKLIVNCYKPGTYTPKIFLKIPAPKWYPITKFYTTLSAINLTGINLIKTSLNTLTSNLINNMSQVKPDIEEARLDTREYGKLYKRFWWIPFFFIYLHIEPFSYNGFIDLYDFTDKLKNQTNDLGVKNGCINLMNTIDNAVIANKALPADSSHGLGVYFPEFKSQYDQSLWRGSGNPGFTKIPSSYHDLSFAEDTLWDEFLKTYLGITKTS